MEFLKNANLAKSFLSAPISSASNIDLSIQAGDVGSFPSSGIFKAILWGQDFASPLADTTREIITLKHKTGSTYTIISRGDEGTTAKAWNENTNIAITITKGKVDELESQFDPLSSAFPAFGGFPSTGLDKICEVVIDQNCNSFTVPVSHASGDSIYYLSIRFMPVGLSSLRLRFNGDTGNNYSMRRCFSDTITISGNNYNLMRHVELINESSIAIASADGSYDTASYIFGIIYTRPFGPRTVQVWESRPYANDVILRTGHWNNSTDNINLIEFTTTNGIGAGTEIIIYRPSLFKPNLVVQNSFEETAPQGTYKMNYIYEYYFNNGIRSMRGAPNFVRQSNAHQFWVYRDGHCILVNTNFDAVKFNKTAFWVYQPTSTPDWGQPYPLPREQGKAYKIWQTRFMCYSNMSSTIPSYIDVLIAGTSIILLICLDHPTENVQEFGISTSIYFNWKHILPDFTIEYNMGGRYQSTKFITENAFIPSDIQSDTDLSHWYVGPFGLFVYDNGNDTVIQGIPYQVEQI